MYRIQMLIVLVALSATWLLGNARAEGQTTRQTSNPSLVQRLDNFGQNLVDGIFSRDKTKKKMTTRQQRTRQEQMLLDEDERPRAGTAISATPSSHARQASGARRTSTSSQKSELLPLGLDGILPARGTNRAASTATARRYGSATQPVAPRYDQDPGDRQPAGEEPQPGGAAVSQKRSIGQTVRSVLDDALAPIPERTPQTPVEADNTATVSSAPMMGGLTVRNTTIAPKQPVADEPATSDQTSDPEIASEPLHQRLERFRRSVFGNTTPQTTQTQPTATESKPSATQPPAAAETQTNSAPAGQPTLAPPRDTDQRTPTLAPSEPVSSPADEASPSPSESVTPSLTQRNPQTPTRAPEQPSEPMVAEATDAPTAGEAEASSPPAPSAEEALVASPAGEPARDDHRVLLTRPSPILNVRTLGPSRIAVGKTSKYEVVIENLGEVAADDVVVTMALPQWADVVAQETTSGAILAEQSIDGGRQLLWKIGPMEAKTRQRAVLGIVPRESRPIDLAVRWDFTPITSQTVIEVEEPRLSLRLEGPREVRFGEPQIFKLEISNSGNGDAEEAVLTLMPLVPGEGAPTQHRLGTLAAGERKVIDMELPARQPGSLAVQMELRCDGPATASLNETLLVRKANVEVAIDAPKMQFTGAVATYRVRVRNSGNAPAEKVRLVVKIPPEAKLVAAGRDGKKTADGQSVQWTLDRLPEGAEQEISLQCELAREGYSQLKAEAFGERVAAEAIAVTRVESIADLALKVSDPPGPVPLGQKANYTISIHNRGTKDASGVEAVVYFSQGIEPVSAEGARSRLLPGQVVFDSIGVIPAGKKVVLGVVAQAQAPGSHMFRAEVYCRPLGTKLVSEETTHFYQGEMDFPGERPMLGSTAPPMGENPARTADRRNEPANPAPAPSEAPAESGGSAPARY